MTVFPVLCSAMLCRFLDRPLNLWSICYMNSFGAYGGTRILSCMQSEYIPIWYHEYTCTFWLCVCLCFYVWLGGLHMGLCRLCTATSTFECGGGYLCMTLVRGLCWYGAIRWRKVVRRDRYLGFLRVRCLLLFPTASRWLLLYCTVRVGDPMHARILFFSVYWVWYYTYVVHHYLFIVVCVLYVTMPCRVELCNCNLFCPFFATIQRKLLDQSIWRKQLLYLTFQYMPMYVLRVCLYVSLITLDRLVLCTPSVLCFLLECSI